MTLEAESNAAGDAAPGQPEDSSEGSGEAVISYSIGLALSALLTAAAFYLDASGWLWAPSIPVALSVLAIAQVGVHLVFFLHLTSSPDSVNNSLALAFGTLIVALVIVGTLWIMAHMNENMPQMTETTAPVRGAHAKIVRGVVEFGEDVPVGAAVEGVVRSVACDVATKVREGQICATMDQAPFERAIAQRQDETRTWEDREKLAEAGMKKAEMIVARPSSKNGAAKERLKAAQARVEEERRGLTEARKALDAAKAALDQTNVRAPIDGVVRARNVEPGSEVGPRTKAPLFVVAKTPDPAEIGVFVTANRAANLRVGEKLNFTVDRLRGRRFEGEVVSLEPSTEPAGYTVRIATPNADRALDAGEEATVVLPPD